MAHQTFKVCILNDENVENFYIKHYIDDINPMFNRFKNQVFNRNPSINTPTLKIYWIDSEEDKILVSCEEDFRLYIEHGKGRKIFFCSRTDTSNIQQQQQQQQQNEQDPSIEVVAMESEDPDEHKCDRKCRKGHKEEEKKRRHVKKLSEKLKHFEEQSRRASEKRECKNAERLERAKRRVEQIRSIIGSIDPANLDSSFEEAGTSSSTSTQLPSGSATKTTSNPNEPHETPVDLLLSPETTRLLSNAIAGCLQPCTVINKVLNEVFAMIPQMIPLPDEQGDGAGGATVSTANSEQQTIEVPKQTTATNTSDASTPVPVRQANDEIEALFKEAAKELEKMNEIVKNNGGGSKMESSTSTSSSLTGVTQIERIYPNISEFVISDSTTGINFESPGEEEEEEEYKQRGQDQQLDMTDSTVMVATPSKMERSRESSIEVHDVGSMMSDDSRDWTILSIDQEVVESPPALATPPTRIANPNMGAIPKETKSVDTSSQVDPGEIPVSETKRDSIKSVTAETQTAISILSEQQQQQLQASVQRSIDIVRKSIQSIHKSAETVAAHDEEAEANASTASNTPVSPSYGFRDNVYPGLKPSASVMAAPIAPETPEQSKANIKAKFAPAVIVYDPNPKINAAVHTMMQMGFTNDDNWLTQLLLNLDGDIPKAIQFLTPQSKKKEN